MKQRVMIVVVMLASLWPACTLFQGHGHKSVKVSLNGMEVTCAMPLEGYSISAQQQRDDQATITYECPAVLNQSGYSIIPLFSMHIEKADSLLNRIKFNNRSRALFEARTLDVLDKKKCLLGGEFIETLQERQYVTIKSKIYLATTTRGKYGIRIMFQVPGEAFDQAFSQISPVIQSVRISELVR
jgi:hypothetical protein